MVRFAQRVLSAAEGERLADDGDLGRMTRAALERFRTKYQLGAGSALDTRTALALAQRALEEIAQSSIFARVGIRDSNTDQAVAAFRAQHGLGFGGLVDAATRRALTDALAARRTVATPSSTEIPASVPVANGVGGKLWTFHAQTLATRVAVYSPPHAAGKAEVDVLVYAHGLLNACKRPKSLPEGMVTDSPFGLGAIVDASHRPIVLVVPLLDWGRPGGAQAFGKDHPRWNALAHPQNLNALVAEVMTELGRVQPGTGSSLGSLVVAGHSRAYDFLEPLAALRDDPQMRQGALARLSEVWAFDTTYSGSVDRWKAWLAAQPGLQVHFFYRPGTRTEPIGYGFYKRRGNRLFVTQCKEGHCSVPARRLPALLRGLTSDHEVADELEFEGEEAYAFDEEGLSDELVFEADSEDEFEELLLSDDFVDEEDEEGDKGEFEDLFDSEEAGTDEEVEFEFDEEDAAEAESELEDEVSDTAPLQLPSDSPVPFAPEPASGSYWPVKTRHEDARVVSYQSKKGITGRSGRMFMASRQGKRGGKTVARRHVGVDLFAYPNDEVVACEAGTIVAFSHFYKAKSKQDTYKLMVEHDGSKVVVNYGEVRSDSLSEHGLAVGSRVVAGQPIAFVSDTAMIHFETYVKGSTTTQRWWKDDKTAPASLLNPTRYLLFLRDHGLVPDSGTVPAAPATPASGRSLGSFAKATAEMVRFAQRVMNAVQAAKLADDGQFGRMTQAAVTRFREDHNLGHGGLDNVTLLALTQRGLEELAQQSMFSQPGQLDDRTKQALADFRSRHGLGADARLDAATRSALTDALAQRARWASASTPTTSSNSHHPARRSGVTPPSDPSAYRQFRLTTYHVVDQADEPTGAARIPIVDIKGNTLGEGGPAFFAKLSLEGTGRLTDGRLVNVTGKTVAVRHADYDDVLAYHNKAYAKVNEKRAKQGRKPVSTRYSGITVSSGQVVRAFAFHVVEPAMRGLGYGMARGVAYEPFRTLAADIGTTKYANVEPRWKGRGGLVPPGTQVYIKEYDGLQIPGIGMHDGWFVVNDTGGAIFGAHFDVFTGTEALRRQVKVPAVGHVWFDGIDSRIPKGYTYGLIA
ncbi:hypothetical protein CATMQ487_36550 [Sphaerotilus microaerophilus]|uniref:3D domain-containing protein n=2 Tax=Sphaerotilus microaerophilus TaxID=2914710 RepID=A0ABN6PS31_9BURK|nr:hypothetical protein CATMQ487_36550 [Sphaerotilus sp. FB-5]